MLQWSKQLGKMIKAYANPDIGAAASYGPVRGRESRTLLNVSVALVLFSVIMFFLISMARLRQDVDSYLRERSDIVYVGAEAVKWQQTQLQKKHCNSGLDCYQYLGVDYKALVDFAPRDHGLEFPASARDFDRVIGAFRLTIEANVWQPLAANNLLVLSLPSMSYQRADLFVDSALVSSFFDNDRITYQFDLSTHGEKPLTIDLVFETMGRAKRLFNLALPRLNKIEKNVSLLSLAEDHAYQVHVSQDKAGRGKIIGFIARIVMAVFVLALFLIIDGSMETLALSLSLGFDALAVSTEFNWLPIENQRFLKHFCYQMADIFRLFFFLRLARVVSAEAKPWLLWGTILSVPFALAYHNYIEWQLTGLHHISRLRDIVIGGVGVAVCWRVAYLLRNKKVPWRVAALLVASVAGFQGMVFPLAAYMKINDTTVVHMMLDLLQPVSAWCLAFSAFINISTLENRVRALSIVEARSREIEREIALGREVQKAFIKIPELPKELRLTFHHEAMSSVSGDTYFVDWNKKTEKLSVVLNDVTGHGIQAALKASGVNVLANTIWSDTSPRPTDTQHDLQRYADAVRFFFERMNEHPDIIAMLGVEFEAKRGLATFYRVNFPFPFIVTPRGENTVDTESRKTDRWLVKLLALPNQTLATFKIEPGSFLVVTSDGFVDNSRRANEFLRYMRRHLASIPGDLTADHLKDLILNCKSFKDNHNQDDRTLIVFHWDAARQSQQQDNDDHQNDPRHKQAV